MSVVIVASGGANIASLQFALERLGAPSEVTADADRIRAASHVILPGVGAAADAMARLRAGGLDALIPSLTQPVLGICLGMQLLFDYSAEDETPCLGILRGRIARLEAAPSLPVPHMGWNTLEARREDPLLEGLGGSEYFYFVHSYAARESPATLAAVRYGHALAAVVSHGNFRGVQFHPERSAQAGARVLHNFLSL